MIPRGGKIKRKRAASISFDELIQKLWQPEPEALQPKVVLKKPGRRAAKSKRIRNTPP
jgi:hypothetical protein